MSVVVHAPVAAAKSGRAESSRTTVVVGGGLGRSGRASWNAASQRLPSLAWPVLDTSRQRLIACFASPSVEARDMRMGRPSSSHRLPVHRRHCSACASFHPDSSVHMSHYMHACMQHHTRDIYVWHVHCNQHSIFSSSTSLKQKRIYTASSCPSLLDPNPASVRVHQQTADNLLLSCCP